MDRISNLCKQIAQKYKNCDPKYKKAAGALCQLGFMGILVYFTAEGIDQVLHGKYKSFRVGFLTLELIYFVVKIAQHSKSARRLLVLAGLLLLYSRFLKVNLYDKNVMEVIAASNV